MKRLVPIATFFVLGIVCLTYVFANEEEDNSLMTVFENWCAAFEAGDADTVISHIDDECTAFAQDGELLIPLFQSVIRGAIEEMKEGLDAGVKPKISVENLNVKVYGNMGVVTAYMRVTVTLPDGKTEKPTPIRHSSTWTKRSGKWKLIHLHQSELTVNLPKEDENVVGKTSVKVRGTDFVLYRVTDLERSIAFYRDTLGMELVPSPYSVPEWAQFTATPTTLALLQMANQRPAGGGVSIALAVDNVVESISELKEKGVTIVSEANETPVSWSGMIADPDGNKIMLHQNKPRDEWWDDKTMRDRARDDGLPWMQKDLDKRNR